MLDISVSSTKVNGWPKGRTRPFAVRNREQIIYPKPLYQNKFLVEGWAIGVIYRKATGKNRGSMHGQPDLYQ